MPQRMVRKQVYLAPDQDRKLKRVAARRGCTEAEVIREALDRLPEPEGGTLMERLAAAGLLVAPPDVDPMSDEELAADEREMDAWLMAQPEPLGLTEAVIAGRRDD